MLPQIALGHSQSSIINTAFFENDILKLHEIMIPNLMSSTMSSETILGAEQKSKEATSNSSTKKTDSLEEKKVGRTEKPDDEKSEKTI